MICQEKNGPNFTFEEIANVRVTQMLLTCLPSGVIRLRLLVEMFRLMDIPANCRLLFPRMLDRVLDGG